LFYSAYDPIVEHDQLSYLNLNDVGRVWVWAHGELQKILDHDQIVCKSIVEYNTMRQATFNKPVKFTSNAMDQDTNVHQVTVYTWQPVAYSPTIRGLVVLQDDSSGNEFAQWHMENKSAQL
jgi:hypothetical protein